MAARSVLGFGNIGQQIAFKVSLQELSVGGRQVQLNIAEPLGGKLTGNASKIQHVPAEVVVIAQKKCRWNPGEAIPAYS